MFHSKLKEFCFEFQEAKGCILLQVEGNEIAESQIEADYRLAGGNIAEIEYACNRFFVYRDFLDIHFPRLKVTDDQLVEIIQDYRQLLEIALNDRYPNKKFNIEVIGENLVDDEPFEVCATFWADTYQWVNLTSHTTRLFAVATPLYSKKSLHMQRRLLKR